MIYVDTVPVGYVQLYNAYDFARDIPLIGLPASLAALDIFIGDSNYVGKGIGTQALKLILERACAHTYAYVFVDPERENTTAIYVYEKVGFKKVKEESYGYDRGTIWMLYKCT